MVSRARGEYIAVPLGLGPCECPGNPHGDAKVVTVVEDGKNVQRFDPDGGGDRCRYKSGLAYGDWRKINAATAEERGARLFLQALIDWNLTDAQGEAIPLDIDGLDNLSLRQGGILVGTLDTPQYVLGDIMKDFADPNPPAGAGDSPAPAKPITDSSGNGPEA